nr:hypothetical protein [Brucella intermedia]
MSNIETGGPAFPACNEANVNGTMGMTLRDYFAAQALIGVVAANNPKSDIEFHLASMDAYSIADAMVKIRESGNGEG